MRVNPQNYPAARGYARNGVVLIAVLLVVVLLSLAAYNYSEVMLSEYKAADSATRALQARANAASGIHYAAASLANKDFFAGTLNSNPFDNEGSFRNIAVGTSDVPRFQGRFSLITPPSVDLQGSTDFRYGAIDEHGKININALLSVDSTGTTAKTILMKLPNMTDEIADAILDWIDADDEIRDNGAENEYYTALSPGYRAKNGPLDTLDELLLVRGVTPELLFGTDRNRNGMRDQSEEADSTGQDRGWSAFLTVYTRERNIDTDGNPRIYLNDKDLTTLYDKLSTAVSPEIADFILAYRLYGPYTASTSGGSSSGGGGGGATGGSTGGGTSSSGGNSASSSGATKAGATGGSTGGSTGATSGGSSGGGATSGRTTTSAAPAATANTAVVKMTFTASGSTVDATGASSVTYANGPVDHSLLNLSGSPKASLSSVYALINAQVGITKSASGTTSASVSGSPLGSMIVSITNAGSSQTVVYTSPLKDPANQRQYLPILLDLTTTRTDPEIPARINLLTAPEAVLTALPNLQDTDAQTIVSRRPPPGSPESADKLYQTSAWLVTEAGLSPTTVQALDRYVTGRSQVYRVQSVGYFDKGGPTARMEAIIDTNGGNPRILHWRDLSELGKGYNVK